MTGWTLLLNIIQNVAVIGILAYLLTRLSAVRRTLCDSQYGLRDKLLLMFVFGLFSAWLAAPWWASEPELSVPYRATLWADIRCGHR